MNLTQFSLKNPLVVASLAVALCLFGVFAYVTLGIAVVPNANYPSVSVITIYQGADPSTIEANVTKPIEDAISSLPNIDTNGLTSTSAYGRSTVSVQLPAASSPWNGVKLCCGIRSTDASVAGHTSGSIASSPR